MKCICKWLLMCMPFLVICVYAQTNLSTPTNPPVSKADSALVQAPTPQMAKAVSVPQLEVRLSGTDLYTALVNDVTRKVDNSAQEREASRWKTVSITGSILLALIGFFGFRTFTDLRGKVAADVGEDLRKHDTLKSLVEDAVRTHVTSDIDARLRTVAKELAFYRLSNLASSLHAGKGFSNTERDAAIESLTQLQNEAEIIRRKEFADALEKILDSFASADLDYEIDRMDVSFRSVIMDTPGIVHTMLMHYGMRVLGDAEVQSETIERFRNYAKACHRLKNYELALPYLMVNEHSEKRQGWETRVAAYIQDAVNLKPEEYNTVMEILKRNSDPSRVAKRSTGQILRFCNKYKAFVAQFNGQFQAAPDINPAEEEQNKTANIDK